MKRFVVVKGVAGAAAVAAIAALVWSRAGSASSGAGSLRPKVAATSASFEARAARGKDLVWSIGCNDCHTPKKMGPKGPELDTTRLLSGHRQDANLPSPPALPEGPWGIVTNMDLTAWSGPWGVTYAFNLTPDVHTGIGIWTEDMFVKALQTGRHMGVSRQILPPMPWEVYGRLPEEDLKSIYAYLRTIPPVSNLVPEPVTKKS